MGDAQTLKSALVPVAFVHELEDLPLSKLAQIFQELGIGIVFELSGRDSLYTLRRTAIDFDIPLITNRPQFVMLFEALSELRTSNANGMSKNFDSKSWQEYFSPAGDAPDRAT